MHVTIDQQFLDSVAIGMSICAPWLQVLETTRGPDMEPISFEVGAGELFANEMIKVKSSSSFYIQTTRDRT